MPNRSAHPQRGLWNASLAIVGSSALLLGLLLSILSSRFIAQPFERLYRVIITWGPSPRQPDKFKYLERIFDDLTTDNDQLRGLLKRSMPQLREKVLLQILINRSMSAGEIVDRARGVDLRLETGSYRVIILSYENNRINTISLLREEIFRRYLDDSLRNLALYHVCQYEPARFAVLINYDPTRLSFRDLSDRFHEIGLYFEREFDSSLTISISTEKNSLDHISEAFLEATRVLEYRQLHHAGQVICFENISWIDDTVYEYPFTLDEKLCNAVRFGRSTDTHSAIDELEAYLRASQSTPFAVRQALFHLYSNIRSTMLEANAGEEPRRAPDDADLLRVISRTEDVAEAVTAIRELTDHALEAVADAQETRKKHLADSICAYIDANCTKRVSMNDIADSFYISVPYMYRLLKEELGISPVHWIEFEKEALQETGDRFHVLVLVGGEKVVVESLEDPARCYTMGFLDMVVVPACVGCYRIRNLGDGPVAMHKTCLKDGFRDYL